MIPKFLRRRREKRAATKRTITKKPTFLPLLEQLEGRVLLNHQPPVAVLDSYETTAGAVFISQLGVLDNDQGDGEALTALMIDPPDHGVIAFGTDGVFFYQSDPAFEGLDTFTYKAVSSAVASEEATVLIHVSAVAGGIAGSGDGSGGGCNGGGSPLGTTSDLNQDRIAGALIPEDALLNIPPLTSLAEDECGGGGSSTDTTSHADGEGNHPPLANNDPDPNIWWRIPVSQELVIAAPGVLGNDSDQDGDALQSFKVNDPVDIQDQITPRGTVTLYPNGAFRYYAPTNWAGSVNFTYVARDQHGAQSSPATVRIDVLNSTPLVHNDTYSTPHGQTLNVAFPGVLTNDSDNGFGSVTVEQLSGQQYATIGANGAFSYQPPAGFVGTVFLTYRLRTAYGAYSPTATVRIDVTNRPPYAGTDLAPGIWWRIPVGQELIIDAPGVRWNDGDPDGDNYDVYKLTNPVSVQTGSQGSVTLYANGAFRYQAPSNWFGAVTFTYRARDVYGAESYPAIVFLDVLNSTPLAVDDTYDARIGQPLNVGFPGVLANDSENGWGHVDVEQLSGQQYATIGANGAFSYQPPAGFTGPVYLTYRLKTPYGAYSPTATVTINVTPPPVANNDEYSVHVNQPMSVDAFFGVLVNDSNLEPAGQLTVHLVAGVQQGTGTLSLQSTGAFSYTPAQGFQGDASFQYKISDGPVDSNIATVTLHVLNTAPVTADDSYTFNATQALTDFAPGVLANDYDADGDSLSAELRGPAAHGSLVFNADGSFTYTAVGGYAGPDSFTYRAWDGMSFSGDTLVSITITGESPHASADSYYALGGSSLSVPQPGVLANDYDPNSAALTAVLVSFPLHAQSFSLAANGSFQYTAIANFVGTDSFSYKSVNSSFASDPVQVTINVVQGPVAVDDTYSRPSSGTLNVMAGDGLLNNDFLPPGAQVTVSPLTGPHDPNDPTMTPRGSLAVNADGSFVYIVDPNYTGPIIFRYVLYWGSFASNPATAMLQPVPLPSLKLFASTFQNNNTVFSDPPSKLALAKDHWLDINLNGVIDLPNEHQYPISFTRNRTMRVSANFVAGGSAAQPYPSNVTLYVRGKVHSNGIYLGIDLPQTKANYVTLDKTYIVKDVNALTPLANHVKYHSSLEVHWEYSIDNGRTWLFAGASSNKAYITLADPASFVRTRLYHTILDISTTRAGGDTSFTEVIPHVWDNFDDRQTTNAAGQLLGYYRAWNTPNQTVDALLTGRDGQCGSWAHLFIDALGSQGINPSAFRRWNVFSSLDGGITANRSIWFLVKNWQFPAGATPGQRFVNIPQSQTTTQLGFPTFGLVPGSPSVYEYKWSGTPQVIDMAGLPGQDSSNPISTFDNHAIVRVEYQEGGQTILKYYDPSYGVTYDSMADMENKAIAGFYYEPGTGLGNRRFIMSINDPQRVQLIGRP